MSRPASAPHDRALRQLLAYSVGVLPETELMWLEEHLNGCPDCRSRLSALKPVSGTSGHLPTWLIATWHRSSALLEGLERELVEAHLEDCAECRAALAFTGQEPVLASVAASEPERTTVRSLGETRSSRTWAWVLAGSGALAGVIAWLLAAHPMASRLGAAGHAVPMAFEFAVDSLAAGAIRLPQPGFRARAAKPIDVGAVTNVSGMVFVLPPALQPPTPEAGERRMVITLLQDGRELASHTAAFYTLGDAIRLRPEGRLEPGDYDLRFALDPAVAGEPPLMLFFRLRVR